MEAVKSNPPDSNNFVKVQKALKDPLLNVKLHFLLSVTTELEDFLTSFQSEKPLMPFLYKQLFVLLRNIGQRFVEGKVISKATNNDLLMLDVKDNTKLKSISTVDIGFGASVALKQDARKDLTCISFKNDCRQFFITLFAILRTKCPLKNKVIYGALCLSPEVMGNKVVQMKRLESILKEFVNSKQITPIGADVIKKNYIEFCSSPLTISKVETFNWRKERLDTFIFDIINAGDFDFPENHFITFIQKVLLLFHGNADVERSFSINKECVIENLTEESLIAQRCTYSALHQNDLKTFEVTKSLIQYAKNASAKRKEHLKVKKMEETDEANKRKELAKNLVELKSKKRAIEELRSEELNSIEQDIQTTQKKIRSTM
jgi:hypothetical protein